MPDEQSTLVRVVLITRDAIYQGTVPGQSASGQPMRFIDILRSPSRIAQGHLGAKAGLVLANATRQSRGGGEEVGFDEPVVLRPDSILAGYDRGESRSAPRTEYEQREIARVRARIFLEGHLALECTLVGGRRSIDGVRTETFVAGTDVELILGRRQRLPFLAVNSARIESFSLLEE